jgi:hypothetical protein
VKRSESNPRFRPSGTLNPSVPPASTTRSEISRPIAITRTEEDLMRQAFGSAYPYLMDAPLHVRYGSGNLSGTVFVCSCEGSITLNASHANIYPERYLRTGALAGPRNQSSRPWLVASGTAKENHPQLCPLWKGPNLKTPIFRAVFIRVTVLLGCTDIAQSGELQLLTLLLIYIFDGG